jgi:hypothetical protein
MARPEGLTSLRRRYLARKVDRLDQLERRTTMTEPISALGLLLGSMRWLEQLGIVDRNMLGSPLGSLAKPGPASAKGQPQAQKPSPASDSFDSIMAARQLAGSGRMAGGGGSSAPTAPATATRNHADDWLTLNSQPGSESSQTGFTTPWQPARPPGGGAAMPPRGGSGGSRGVRPAVRGAITPLTLPPSMPGAHTGPSSGSPPAAPPSPGSGNGDHASAASNPSAPAAPTGNPGVISPVGSSPTQPAPGTGQLSADSLSGGSGGTPLPGSTPDPVTGNSLGPVSATVHLFSHVCSRQRRWGRPVPRRGPTCCARP